jgi:hypothetical protein
MIVARLAWVCSVSEIAVAYILVVYAPPER